MEINFLISLAGVLGAGVSAYVGVRVALAEVKGDLRRHEDKFEAVEERIGRLERQVDANRYR